MDFLENPEKLKQFVATTHASGDFRTYSNLLIQELTQVPKEEHPQLIFPDPTMPPPLPAGESQNVTSGVLEPNVPSVMQLEPTVGSYAHLDAAI